jgi:type I restriction enzyme S subunit
MDGWHTTTIEEACNVEYGTRVVQKRDGGSIYPVYGGGGATFFMDTTNRADRVVVSRFGMSEQCTRYVVGQFFLNDSGLTLSPKDTGTLLPKFLDRLTLALNDEVFALGKGAAQKNLDVPAFRQLRLTYPSSLSEQCRIVTILDEAFETIATANVNAEKNLQSARELFQVHLEMAFLGHEEGWVSTKLGRAFRTLTGSTPSKANATYFGDFMPLVKPPELLDDVVEDAVDGLSHAGASISRVLPVGSVMVSCIGNLGKIGINSVSVACNQQINAILPDENTAVPEFMFFQALGRPFKKQLARAASGTTVPIVNKSKFNEIEIVLPPRARQQEMVESLRALRAESNLLAAIFDQKLTALDELKKSLLHQAFSGALTEKSTHKQVAEVV